MMFRVLQSLCFAGLLLPACADLGTAPIPAPSPEGAPAHSTGDADPPKDWPVVIRAAAVSTDMAYLTHFPSQANVDGFMRYDAYHASMGADLTIRDRSGVVQRTYTPLEKHTGFSYYDQTFSARFQMYVRESCGTTLEGLVNYRAWWRGFPYPGGELVLDEAVAQRSVSAAQTACTCIVDDCGGTGDDGGGGGGGGGGGDTGGGATYCVVHYTYDMATGEVLSWQVLYCY